MIVSVVHDPQAQSITIITPSKTVQMVYSGLPPQWPIDPPAFEGAVVTYVNGLIELRTDRRVWLRDSDFKVNDPLPFTDSERQWYDINSDEVVFMDCIVTAATWNSDQQQYLLSVRNTSQDIPR